MKVYNTQNQVKLKKQKGFTFVELLVIMVIIAIIGGIGIQFVLSTQEDKAKLTNARTFFGKDFPNAVMSCLVRKNEVTDCTKEELSREDLDMFTEWGDNWAVASPASSTNGGTLKDANTDVRTASRSIVLCYPLEEVAVDDRETIAKDIIEYMDDETSWTASGDNNDGQGYIVATSMPSGDTSQGVYNCKGDNAIGGTSGSPTVQVQIDQNTGVAKAGTAPTGSIGSQETGSTGDMDTHFVEVMYVVRRR